MLQGAVDATGAFSASRCSLECPNKVSQRRRKCSHLRGILSSSVGLACRARRLVNVRRGGTSSCTLVRQDQLDFSRQRRKTADLYTESVGVRSYSCELRDPSERRTLTGDRIGPVYRDSTCTLFLRQATSQVSISTDDERFGHGEWKSTGPAGKEAFARIITPGSPMHM